MATKEVVHAKVVFTDFGDSGTYTGDLSSNLQRHGRGKMVYASGNTFEGEFVNSRKEGLGVLHLANGSEQRGRWVKGVFKG